MVEKINKENPMGVSQWKNHGKKYGYWDHFKEDVLFEERQRICSEIADMFYPITSRKTEEEIKVAENIESIVNNL